MKYIKFFLIIFIVTSGSNLFSQKENSQKTMYVTAKSGLNEREKPSSDSKIIRKLSFWEKVIVYKRGPEITMDGITNHWYKTDAGWIFGGYLFPERMYVTAKDGLIQREEPLINSKRIGKFSFGERVYVKEQGPRATIDGIADHWYKIYDDGWVFGGFLSEKFPGITYPDGSEYAGRLKDGKPHGKGTMVYSDGSKYAGEWKVGKRDGSGEYPFVYSDWGHYSGQWKDDKRHGKGKLVFGDACEGYEYSGEWKDDKRHGEGAEISSDCEYCGDEEPGCYEEKYTGQWKNDLKNGEGTKIFRDGSKYTGQWKDGKMHGKGTMYDSKGKVTKQGTFKDGEYTGK
jgi:hypothetical protein